MVKISLNKQDIMNILAWGGSYKANVECYKPNWEKDEEKTLQKIKSLLEEK